MSHRKTTDLAPVFTNMYEGVSQMHPDWQKFFSNVAEKLPRFLKKEVSVNVTSVSANTTSEQAIPVTGAELGDFVWVEKPSHSAGLGIVNCRVSAANEVSVTFMNTTGSPIDPASETYTFLILKV